MLNRAQTQKQMISPINFARIGLLSKPSDTALFTISPFLRVYYKIIVSLNVDFCLPLHGLYGRKNDEQIFFSEK